MGCVSGKSKRNTRVSSGKKQETEPTLRNDEIGLEFDGLEGVVCSKACGYVFNDCQKQINPERTQETSSPTLTDILLTHIQNCKTSYTNHEIDTAWEELSRLQKFVQSTKKSPEWAEIKQILSLNNSLLSSISQEYKDVIMYEKQIKKGGWIQKSHRNGVRVSTRREQTTVGVLVQSIVEEPFEVLISLCIQMDLYKDWMPFMKISRQEKVVDRNCRVGFTENHLPIISVRQAFFQGIGYNRLQTNNTLFLYTRSLHNRPDLQQKLGYNCNINPDNVQLEYKYFVVWYEPISKGKGHLTLAMNVDIKLDFIPMWIQDKISQDFGEEFFGNIVKLSKKFKGSQWEKNTSANPELFLFFKNAIDCKLQQIERENKHPLTNDSTGNNQSMERMNNSPKSRNQFL